MLTTIKIGDKISAALQHDTVTTFPGLYESTATARTVTAILESVVGLEQGVHADRAIGGPVLGGLQLLHGLQQLLALEAGPHVGHLALLLQLGPGLQQAPRLLCLVLDLVQQLIPLVHVSPLTCLHLQANPHSYVTRKRGPQQCILCIPCCCGDVCWLIVFLAELGLVSLG